MSNAVVSEPLRERWRTAGRVADVLDGEIKSRRHPLAARVVSWYNLCRICQDFEEQMLLEDSIAQDKQPHAALLATAIASGERLLLEGADAEMLKSINVTPEAIDAKLESLRITYEQWLTEINPERQAAVLKEVFGYLP